jgi:hypothetical protein
LNLWISSLISLYVYFTGITLFQRFKLKNHNIYHRQKLLKKKDQESQDQRINGPKDQKKKGEGKWTRLWMDLLWTCFGFAVDLLWICWGLAVDIYGLIMDLLKDLENRKEKDQITWPVVKLSFK